MVAVLSTAGARFIGAWEGFRGAPYNDSRNNATIGIGHLLHLGPVTAADKAKWGTITYAKALAMLQADAYSNGIRPVEQNVKVTLTQPQKDALICFCFNVGPGGLDPGGAVTTAVNSKPRAWNIIGMRNWHGRVRAALLLWAHPSELLRRRESEAYLFATGKYTKATGNPYSNE